MLNEAHGRMGTRRGHGRRSTERGAGYGDRVLSIVPVWAAVLPGAGVERDVLPSGLQGQPVADRGQAHGEAGGWSTCTATTRRCSTALRWAGISLASAVGFLHYSTPASAGSAFGPGVQNCGGVRRMCDDVYRRQSAVSVPAGRRNGQTGRDGAAGGLLEHLQPGARHLPPGYVADQAAFHLELRRSLGGAVLPFVGDRSRGFAVRPVHRQIPDIRRFLRTACCRTRPKSFSRVWASRMTSLETASPLPAGQRGHLQRAAEHADRGGRDHHQRRPAADHHGLLRPRQCRPMPVSCGRRTALPAGCRRRGGDGVRQELPQSRAFTRTTLATDQQVAGNYVAFIDATISKGVYLTRFVDPNVGPAVLPGQIVPETGQLYSANADTVCYRSGSTDTCPNIFASGPFPTLGAITNTISNAKSLYRGLTVGDKRSRSRTTFSSRRSIPTRWIRTTTRTSAIRLRSGMRMYTT